MLLKDVSGSKELYSESLREKSSWYFQTIFILLIKVEHSEVFLKTDKRISIEKFNSQKKFLNFFSKGDNSWLKHWPMKISRQFGGNFILISSIGTYLSNNSRITSARFLKLRAPMKLDTLQVEKTKDGFNGRSSVGRFGGKKFWISRTFSIFSNDFQACSVPKDYIKCKTKYFSKQQKICVIGF